MSSIDPDSTHNESTSQLKKADISIPNLEMSREINEENSADGSDNEDGKPSRMSFFAAPEGMKSSPHLSPQSSAPMSFAQTVDAALKAQKGSNGK